MSKHTENAEIFKKRNTKKGKTNAKKLPNPFRAVATRIDADEVLKI